LIYSAAFSEKSEAKPTINSGQRGRTYSCVSGPETAIFVTSQGIVTVRPQESVNSRVSGCAVGSGAAGVSVVSATGSGVDVGVVAVCPQPAKRATKSASAIRIAIVRFFILFSPFPILLLKQGNTDI